MRYLCSFFLGMSVFACAQEARPVRVAVYMDKGSPRTPRDMQRVLKGDPRFEVRYLRAEDIREGGLKFFDVLVQGGGDSRVQSAELEGEGREAIRSFVREGGGYVGICAGAHFTVPVAGDKLKLGILNVQVVDNEHWARGNGDVVIRLSDDGRKELAGTREEERLEYHQGPILVPGDRADLPPVTVLARYETEVAKNGAPHGIMPGKAAIVNAPYGKGRVFVFGPHPEMTRGQEGMVKSALLWAAQRDGVSLTSSPQPQTTVSLPQGLSAQPAAAVTVASATANDGCCGPISEKGWALVKYLDSLNVDHLWPQHTFVNWETGVPIPSHGRHEPKTHCSIFAAAAAERLNIYMMRPPDHRQSELAAAQERYFESSRGRRDGWTAVASPTEAQRRANLGEFVVLVYGDPNPHKSGHIAIVRPAVKTVQAMEKEGPQTTQAGGHNFSNGTAVYSFVFHPGAWPTRVKMFAHTIDFTQPLAMPHPHDPSQDLDEDK